MPRISEKIRKLCQFVASTGLGKDVSAHVLFAAAQADIDDLAPIKLGDELMPKSSLVHITTNYKEKQTASYKEKGFFQNAIRGMDFDFDVTVTVNNKLLPYLSMEAVGDENAVITFTCNFHKNEKNNELEALISQLEKAVEQLNEEDNFVCAYNQTIFAFNQQLAYMKHQRMGAYQDTAAYQAINKARTDLYEAYIQYSENDGDLGVFCQKIQASYDELNKCKKHCRNVLIPYAILGALVFAAFVAAVVAAVILAPPVGGTGLGLGLFAAAKAAVATTATASSLCWLPFASSVFGALAASAAQLPWVAKMVEYNAVNRSLKTLGTFKTPFDERNKPMPVSEPPVTLRV